MSELQFPGRPFTFRASVPATSRPRPIGIGQKRRHHDTEHSSEIPSEASSDDSDRPHILERPRSIKAGRRVRRRLDPSENDNKAPSPSGQATSSSAGDHNSRHAQSESKRSLFTKMQARAAAYGPLLGDTELETKMTSFPSGLGLHLSDGGDSDIPSDVERQVRLTPLRSSSTPRSFVQPGSSASPDSAHIETITRERRGSVVTPASSPPQNWGTRLPGSSVPGPEATTSTGRPSAVTHRERWNQSSPPPMPRSRLPVSPSPAPRGSATARVSVLRPQSRHVSSDQDGDDEYEAEDEDAVESDFEMEYRASPVVRRSVAGSSALTVPVGSGLGLDIGSAAAAANTTWSEAVAERDASVVSISRYPIGLGLPPLVPAQSVDAAAASEDETASMQDVIDGLSVLRTVSFGFSDNEQPDATLEPTLEIAQNVDSSSSGLPLSSVRRFRSRMLRGGRIPAQRSVEVDDPIASAVAESAINAMWLSTVGQPTIDYDDVAMLSDSSDASTQLMDIDTDFDSNDEDSADELSHAPLDQLELERRSAFAQRQRGAASSGVRRAIGRERVSAATGHLHRSSPTSLLTLREHKRVRPGSFFADMTARQLERAERIRRREIMSAANARDANGSWTRLRGNWVGIEYVHTVQANCDWWFAPQWNAMMGLEHLVRPGPAATPVTADNAQASTSNAVPLAGRVRTRDEAEASDEENRDEEVAALERRFRRNRLRRQQELVAYEEELQRRSAAAQAQRDIEQQQQQAVLEVVELQAAPYAPVLGSFPDAVEAVPTQAPEDHEVTADALALDNTATEIDAYTLAHIGRGHGAVMHNWRPASPAISIISVSSDTDSDSSFAQSEGSVAGSVSSSWSAPPLYDDIVLSGHMRAASIAPSPTPPPAVPIELPEYFHTWDLFVPRTPPPPPPYNCQPLSERMPLVEAEWDPVSEPMPGSYTASTTRPPRRDSSLIEVMGSGSALGLDWSQEDVGAFEYDPMFDVIDGFASLPVVEPSPTRRATTTISPASFTSGFVDHGAAAERSSASGSQTPAGRSYPAHVSTPTMTATATSFELGPDLEEGDEEEVGFDLRAGGDGGEEGGNSRSAPVARLWNAVAGWFGRA